MLLALAGPAGGQLTLQCPAEKATVSEEGVIMFSPISDTTPVVPVYVEPGLSAWYAMANGFISGVGRQSLPYGEKLCTSACA